MFLMTRRTKRTFKFFQDMCPDREEYKVIDTPLVYKEVNKEVGVLLDVPESLFVSWVSLTM